MSEDWKATVSRRPLLAALGTILGVGVVGGAIYEGGHALFHRLPKGPYGHLLAELGDMPSATRVGRAVLAEMPDFRATAVAGNVRRGLAGRSLPVVLTEDAVEGRIDEVQAWVLPVTLTQLCGLAASQ